MSAREMHDSMSDANLLHTVHLYFLLYGLTWEMHEICNYANLTHKLVFPVVWLAWTDGRCLLGIAPPQVSLCFHSTENIPLPEWIVEESRVNPDLFYTDKAGGRCTECLTLGVDEGERVAPLRGG